MKETKTIEECFYHIQNGANIKQGVLGGGYPITRIETISNDKFNRDKMGYAGIENLESYASYVLEDGDLLMSHINSVQYLGRTVLYKRQGDEIIIHGMNLLRLKANGTLINPIYARYYFSSRTFREQVRKITKKSVNQASFSVSDLKKIKVILPDLTKQKEIAIMLENVNDLLFLHKKQIQQFDDLIKSRFVEMFGIPGSNEKGWGISMLGKCCVLNPKKGEDKRLRSGMKVSFIPMSAITENGNIDVSETKLYDEVKTGFTYFSENDVLFAKITPCMENGKGAVAAGLCNGVGFGSTEFHVIRPVENVSNPYWLYHLMSFNTFRNDAAVNMTGSAGQRRVPVTFLENYKISLPPIHLQNEFAAFVRQVDKLKFETQKCA